MKRAMFTFLLLAQAAGAAIAQNAFRLLEADSMPQILCLNRDGPYRSKRDYTQQSHIIRLPLLVYGHFPRSRLDGATFGYTQLSFSF